MPPIRAKRARTVSVDQAWCVALAHALPATAATTRCATTQRRFAIFPRTPVRRVPATWNVVPAPRCAVAVPASTATAATTRTVPGRATSASPIPVAAARPRPAQGWLKRVARPAEVSAKTPQRTRQTAGVAGTRAPTSAHHSASMAAAFASRTGTSHAAAASAAARAAASPCKTIRRIVGPAALFARTRRLQFVLVAPAGARRTGTSPVAAVRSAAATDARICRRVRLTAGTAASRALRFRSVVVAAALHPDSHAPLATNAARTRVLASSPRPAIRRRPGLAPSPSNAMPGLAEASRLRRARCTRTHWESRRALVTRPLASS
jgi:hypothetical protein